MKPRLNPASPTEEDELAWNHYMRRRGLRDLVYDVMLLYVRVKEADRLDANLMYLAQTTQCGLIARSRAGRYVPRLIRVRPGRVLGLEVKTK